MTQIRKYTQTFALVMNLLQICLIAIGALLTVAQVAVADDLDVFIEKLKSDKYVTANDFLALKSEILKYNDKEKVSETIADRLAEEVGKQELKGVDPSKLYYLGHSWVLENIYDEPQGVLTDVTWVPEYRRVVPFILSNRSIDNSPTSATQQGIYFKKLEDIYLDGFSTQYIDEKWTTQNKSFSTSIVITSIAGAGNLVTKRKSLDYETYWRDNRRLGLIFASTNMGKVDQIKYMNEYIEYFKEMGFSIEDANKNIHLKSFLKEKVISGELDYLIKNAHTVGDDRNIFKIDKDSKLMIAKKSNGSKVEMVYLLLPTAVEGSEFVTNNEFGSWMRQREAHGGGELLYVNGSCNSYAKAIKEIQAARTPLLVDIPTVTVYIFFFNSKQSGLLRILNSFYAEQNFSEMYKNMQESEWFKDGDDHFIFPSTEKYQDEIVRKIQTPVEVEIKMWDGEKHEYSPQYH